MAISSATDLQNRRVLITGAARGIGSALARRLHERGAIVALAGLEPELLAATSRSCADAPWREADVSDSDAISASVDALAAELGGLDVVVANAGIAKQLPIIGGQPGVMEQTMSVNFLGCFYTLRAAGPHISHPGGYALAVSSLAAAVNLPLLGAYSASKAAVEALGNTLRAELKSTGAKAGVAYFAELDTDMTTRGFATEAARSLTGGKTITRVSSLSSGVDALERGIARRSRRIYAPRWIRPIVPLRDIAQRVVDLRSYADLPGALETARHETAEFTTAQPSRVPR
ncbi:SDR family NAD(P)-dependent oxidoreductase [Blastococcus sp. Marseille-P5729]|uniref:SDR family NAD(P)-dependent oxidoreductase n=1 Tax=Blastococcus sp. Marseille-P5729 TaxID=2086582 RepID=UPI000D100C82|nr:SDR family NAD(P)-dependent oxidoreductase [Blastococcus sp. Marseille-P5729]